MPDGVAIFMSFARTTDRPIPVVKKAARCSTKTCRSDQRFMVETMLGSKCVEDKALPPAAERIWIGWKR